ncbi:hypothetical protein BaRGS_00007952, partial [Batillaria attramentaria]
WRSGGHLANCSPELLPSHFGYCMRPVTNSTTTDCIRPLSSIPRHTSSFIIDGDEDSAIWPSIKPRQSPAANQMQVRIVFNQSAWRVSDTMLGILSFAGIDRAMSSEAFQDFLALNSYKF